MVSLAILFFVQIVVESVPVSSSGHVVLVERILRRLYGPFIFYDNWDTSDLLSLLLHVMHIPTLIIVTFFFLHRWLRVTKQELPCRVIVHWGSIIFLVDAITACWYFIFKHQITVPLPLSVGFTITAALLFSLRWVIDQKRYSITWQDGIIFGMVQGAALLPGISRFAAVFVAVRWRGFNNNYAFCIAWLVQVPLMIAAGMRSGYLLWINQDLNQLYTFSIGTAVMCATLLGALGFYGVYHLAITNRLWWFAWYMLFVAGLAALI